MCRQWAERTPVPTASGGRCPSPATLRRPMGATGKVGLKTRLKRFFFQGELGGLNLKITIIFIYHSIFLKFGKKNSCCYCKVIQLGWNQNIRKRTLFYFGEGRDNLNIFITFIYHKVKDFYDIRNIVSWCHYKVIRSG